MKQSQPTKRSWKVAIYQIAGWTWTIMAWIWTTIIIAFIIQFVSALLLEKDGNLGDSINATIWARDILPWIGNVRHPFPSNILPLLAIIAIVGLAVVTLIAFVLKSTLRNVLPQGIEKLIEVIQQDTITPQLELLLKQLQQQIQQQMTIIDGLKAIHRSLHKSPLSGQIQELHTSLQMQHDLQKRMYKEAQNTHQSIAIQGQQLDKNVQTQEAILDLLKNIDYLLEQGFNLEQGLDDSDTAHPSWSPQKNEVLPEQSEVTEYSPLLPPFTQTGKLEASPHADTTNHP